jgi:hypothetical protein
MKKGSLEKYIRTYMKKIVQYWIDNSSCDADDKVIRVLDTLKDQIEILIKEYHKDHYTIAPWRGLRYLEGIDEEEDPGIKAHRPKTTLKLESNEPTTQCIFFDYKRE